MEEILLDERQKLDYLESEMANGKNVNENRYDPIMDSFWYPHNKEKHKRGPRKKNLKGYVRS